MVVELGAIIGVAAGIIDSSSSTRRAFFSTFEGHVCLGADHWFDAVIVAGVIEVQDAVHVPMIGDTQRWLSVSGCRSDSVRYARGPI